MTRMSLILQTLHCEREVAYAAPPFLDAKTLTFVGADSASLVGNRVELRLAAAHTRNE